jgi:hypothetical protein
MKWARRRHARARKQLRLHLEAFRIAGHSGEWGEILRLEPLIPLAVLVRAIDAGTIHEVWLLRALEEVGRA